MFPDFTTGQILLTAVIFVWTGFVRSGLGFGGAALGLPILLFINPDPLLWLPMIGAHLLLFSGITLRTRFHNIDGKLIVTISQNSIGNAITELLGVVVNRAPDAEAYEKAEPAVIEKLLEVRRRLIEADLGEGIATAHWGKE